MIKTISTIILLSFLPFSASAQDIRVKMAEIPIGSWWVTKTGSTLHMHVVRKRQGKNYVVDIVNPSDPNGPRIGRDIRDADGNVVKRIEASGLTTIFKPHNCQRVVGRCEFTTKQSGKGASKQGQTAQMVRTIKLKGKGFSFEQIFVTEGNGLHIQSGTVASLDEFGIVERARGVSGFKKKKFTLRKVKASWD